MNLIAWMNDMLYVILLTTKDKLVWSNKNLHADNGKSAMDDLLAALKVEYPMEQFVVDTFECWKEGAVPSVEEGKERVHLEEHYRMRLNGASDEKGPREFSHKFLKAWKKTEQKAA